MNTLNMMGSRKSNHSWSVFDNVKRFPPTPYSLIAEIDSAISKHEYAHATTLLQAPSLFTNTKTSNKSSIENSISQYDAQMADEAYKVGLASLAAGKLDKSLLSLNTSLSKCPPDKTLAVAKLQSLISLTSQQLHKPQK